MSLCATSANVCGILLLCQVTSNAYFLSVHFLKILLKLFFYCRQFLGKSLQRIVVEKFDLPLNKNSFALCQSIRVHDDSSKVV